MGLIYCAPGMGAYWPVKVRYWDW